MEETMIRFFYLACELRPLVKGYARSQAVCARPTKLPTLKLYISG